MALNILTSKQMQVNIGSRFIVCDSEHGQGGGEEEGD